MISTARHKMKMKTQPSVDERKEAVFDMKNNKFSGLDEIPCKFYQYIWSLIGCYFMKYYYPFLLSRNVIFTTHTSYKGYKTFFLS